MSATLLDANVLIALSVDDHQMHPTADAWWTSRDPSGYATCPLTQGALLRFLVRGGMQYGYALDVLAEWTAHADHVFWPDDLGYESVLAPTLVGHRQVTDAYLAQLARRHGGQLATLDRGLVATHPDVAVLASA